MKGLLVAAAFFLFFAETKADPIPFPVVQRISTKGDVLEIKANLSSSKTPACNALQFLDSGAFDSSIQFTLVQGQATLKRLPTGKIEVCLYSKTATFSAIKNNASIFHYVLDKAPAPVVVVAPKPNLKPTHPGPITVYAGFIQHHYKNTDETVSPAIESDWSGLQVRVGGELKLPVHWLGDTIIHALGTIDTLNSNLSQQIQGSLTLQKKIFPQSPWNAAVGLGVSSMTILGGLPYGLWGGVSPILELELNRTESLEILFSYSPFVVNQFDLSSAEYQLRATYPVSHQFRLGLGLEIMAVPPNVSPQAVQFNSYGYSAFVGYRFGESL